jgi:hypothetical protein
MCLTDTVGVGFNAWEQAVEDIVARLRPDCDVAQEIERVAPCPLPPLLESRAFALDPLHAP